MGKAGKDNITVVLPSLNPSDKFDGVVDGLIEAGFKDIVIVDDGSREEAKGHFRRAEALPECHVLTHEVNRGKGAALKNAFRFVTENRPGSAGCVTIDGDGQHLTRDILACVDAMDSDDAIIMGCRDFTMDHIPARSRMGNRFTSLVFRVCCGIKLSDTQTGLRVIPRALLPELLDVRGDRFDYETNMLLELSRRGVRFSEVSIETVYEDGNSESHFRPVVDSLRIYRFILLYMLSSVIGMLADLGVFQLAMSLLTLPQLTSVAVATVASRTVSSLLNFNINSRLVFHGKGGYWTRLRRYYTLAIPQMLVSMGLVGLLSRMAETGSSILTTVIKAVVDTLLFFISFRIQQSWVFKSEKQSPR